MRHTIDLTLAKRNFAPLEMSGKLFHVLIMQTDDRVNTEHSYWHFFHSTWFHDVIYTWIQSCHLHYASLTICCLSDTFHVANQVIPSYKCTCILIGRWVWFTTWEIDSCVRLSYGMSSMRCFNWSWTLRLSWHNWWTLGEQLCGEMSLNKRKFNKLA